MVCYPFVHEFLLLALLWLVVIAYGTWQRGQAPKPPPAEPPKRRPKAPTPFAGLTPKPHCQGCEQSQEDNDLLPLSPPPVVASKRGRLRAVDTSPQYCPEKTCPYYGWVGRGNIHANGHPGGGPWRQLQCVVGQTYFLETRGTVFHGKRVPAELLVRVMAALAEGVGLRAVARVFEVDPNTVLHWLGAVADQLQAFSRYFLHDLHLRQVQLDELFAVLSAVQAGAVSEAEALERLSRSPHWVWVALDPVSNLLLSIDLGARNLAMAQRLVHHVGQVLAPGCLPLFLTDGFKAYATAILTHFGRWIQPARHTLSGPCPKPRWMPLPGLLYAQVVKPYRRRRLVGTRHGVVFGTLAQIMRVLAPRGWHINTAFLERLNFTLRHHVAAVGRRVITLCKREAGLRCQLHLYHTYYTFCFPHGS
jgi:IS1 family transposase